MKTKQSSPGHDGYLPAPRLHKLSAIRRQHVLATLRAAVSASPVLSFLRIEVRPGGGRFWFVREGRGVARLTPAGPVRRCLEIRRESGWSVMTMAASEREVVEALAANDDGTVHWLGSLEGVLLAEAETRGASATIIERDGDDFVVDFTPQVRDAPGERCILSCDDAGWQIRPA